MSYVSDNLTPGEKIVYSANVHWAIYIFPCALGAVSLFMFVSAAAAEHENKAPIAVLGVIVLLVAAFAALGAFISKATTEYAVTNKRIILKTGFISRRTTELLLQKIEGFTFDQPILGRLLDFGTIRVGGTGGGKGSYPYCESPLELRRHVNAQVEAMEKPKVKVA